jgi:CRP/FNR family cyclic AMP-dependent transcriptional regulator
VGALVPSWHIGSPLLKPYTTVSLPPDDLSAIRSLMQQGRWFVGLPPALQDRLLQAASVVSLDKGARLFSRGDANSGLYAVLSGAIRVGAVGASGKEALVAVAEAPQWFGEIALIDGGPRTHDADAREACTLLWVPLPALHAILAEDPSRWQAFGQLAMEKLRALFVSVEELSLLAAPARIARRLLSVATGHGMLVDGQTRLSLQLNQEQLGAMLALTRQTVNLVLKDFEARGLLHCQYGRIDILDWAALQREGQG